MDSNLNMPKTKLILNWCGYDAAKFACENWHYSKSIPGGKLVKIGVWENDCFIGVILFGSGANKNMASPYGLSRFDVCELVRVALTKHITPVSRILSIAIKLLKKQSPNLKLIVSYADSAHGHYGGIYQAGGWIYMGERIGVVYRINGVIIHRRTMDTKYNATQIKAMRARNNLTSSKASAKYKYIYPLSADIKERLLPLSKPYPKKV